MNNDNKKRKVSPVIWVIVSIAVIVAAVIVLIPVFAKAGVKISFDNIIPDTHKYASEYDLEVGKRKHSVLGVWTIRKAEHDGVICLDVYHPGTKDHERDYMDYLVFDSASDARKDFDKFHDKLEDYIQEEGDNWFTAWMPDVCDATIKSMFYLEDNMIISTDIEIYSEWTSAVDLPETTETTAPVFDRSLLKDYIFGNAPELRTYVLKTILPGKTPDEEREDVRASVLQEMERRGDR